MKILGFSLALLLAGSAFCGYTLSEKNKEILDRIPEGIKEKVIHFLDETHKERFEDKQTNIKLGLNGNSIKVCVREENQGQQLNTNEFLSQCLKGEEHLLEGLDIQVFVGASSSETSQTFYWEK